MKKGLIKNYISLDSELGKLLYFSKYLDNLEKNLEKLKEVNGFSFMVEKLKESYEFEDFSDISYKIYVASIFLEYFDELEIETKVEESKINLFVKHQKRTICFCFFKPNLLSNFMKEISKVRAK